MENGWYTTGDVDLWSKTTGRQVKTVGDLADMLTDFFYGMKNGDDVVFQGGRITREHIVDGKQAVLCGLTMKQIRQIADSTNYNEGLTESIKIMHLAGIVQSGFSDGLGPFVIYHMAKQHLQHKEATPALIMHAGEESVFREPLIYCDDVSLAGKVKPYKKSEAIFAYISQKRGVPLNACAAIDDSAANVPMLKKILEGGGLAVGYNVNDTKAFAEANLPVLNRPDLRAFAEIVLDRKKIGIYC